MFALTQPVLHLQYSYQPQHPYLGVQGLENGMSMNYTGGGIAD